MYLGSVIQKEFSIFKYYQIIIRGRLMTKMIYSLDRFLHLDLKKKLQKRQLFQKKSQQDVGFVIIIVIFLSKMQLGVRTHFFSVTTKFTNL